MKTIRLTTAQALVRFLDNQYIEFDGKETKFVEGIFTIFGHGNVLGIGQALEELDHNLVVHQGRNEQGMAHAATGFAKQNLRKKIYAVTSSVGPGAANMVTAAATATANRIPVLLLPGDTYASRQPDPVLQQLEQFDSHMITTNDAFQAVTKYYDRIVRPEQLMSAMINAMRVLTDPADTGAVCIALPQDVQGEAYDYPESFLKKRVHIIERRRPSSRKIEKAVGLIKKKKKPVLICGGGVRYSEAYKEFKKFAEAFNIPFGETQAGKSALRFDHPLNLGGMGTTGTLSANLLAKEADLIIGVGTRYSDFTTASKWLFRNEDVEFVNINIAEFDAYKLDGVSIVADAKKGLKSLRKALEKEGYKSDYKEEIKEAKDKWEQEVKRLFDVKVKEGFVPEINDNLKDRLKEYEEVLGTSLTQTAVLGMLDNYMSDEDIAVGAAGSLPGDLQRLFRAKGLNTYHMEYGYSCMGYEIGAALGVKLAKKDSEVYAYVGDGSYMMLHSELVTSIQDNAKINVLLFDNIGFGCINNLQMGHGMGSYGTEMRRRDENSNELTGELLTVDFAMNARSYGCQAFTVRSEEQLLSALEEARKSDVSTLIDIKVLPKTMTDGYEAWWLVGNAEVSSNEEIMKATNKINIHKKEARKY